MSSSSTESKIVRRITSLDMTFLVFLFFGEAARFDKKATIRRA
jgi:hypothetical protein